MTNRKAGIRTEIYTLRELSTLLEKNPWLPRPDVSIKSSAYSDDEPMTISFNLFAPLPLAGGQTHKERMEESYLLIANLFHRGGWDKNDPDLPGASSYDQIYYEMSTAWHDAKVKIGGYRKDICERVVLDEYEEEVEVPDPAVVDSAPLVKQKVTKQVVGWECNKRIAQETHTLIVKEPADA